MNKRRRYKAKRKRAGRRALSNMMAARHVGAADRGEVERFADYLAGRMSPTARADYESGRS